MLVWTISIRDRQNARAKGGDELMDQSGAMRKYRWLSLLLLVPLLPVILVARGKGSNHRP
jgi:hypothetical protein